MNLDGRSIDILQRIFREKMLDVYSKNYNPNSFGDKMIAEYNAWQSYLRDGLQMEVLDAQPGETSGLVRDDNKNRKVKIMNPSNGASFGQECILMTADFAEKALVLGGLPERI